jgi:hypothetical protein
MNEPTKIPPDKVDALAERLQTSLKRGRPRTWLVVVAATCVAIGLLALLAWWLYKPTQAPRLEVIALDAVAAVEKQSRVAALLALPDRGEYPASVLRDHECVFEIGGKQVKAQSDAKGRAAIDWGPIDKPAVEAIAVRYVDVRNKQGSADQAKLFAWPAGSKVLVVDVVETLAQIEPERWASTHGADIPPRPDAARVLQQAERNNWRVAYLAVTDGALDYRKVRGWIGAPRPAADRFPAGPVLGNRDFDVENGADKVRQDRVKDLVDQFGGDVTLVTRSQDAASAGKSAGARVIVLDPAIKMPGVRSVPGWSDVIPLLDRKRED